MADSPIDLYIAGFPEATQRLLMQVRETIAKTAPKATEKMAYGIPTFWLQGNLVHFAAFKNHIGFYPAPSAICAFAERLQAYKQSKGAVQFPLDQKLPLELIAEMTRFRVQEQLEK